MAVKERVFWRDCVVLLVLVMGAIGMLGEVYRQDWVAKEDNFPGMAEAARLARARELVEEMTPEERVGQLFYGRHVAGTVTDARMYHLGGVLLDTAGLTDWELRTIEAALPGEVFVSRQVPELEGLRVVTDVRRSYVQALRDGGDMILTADYRAGIWQVVRAVESGALPEAVVEEAVVRVVMVKLERGMMR